MYLPICFSIIREWGEFFGVRLTPNFQNPAFWLVGHTKLFLSFYTRIRWQKLTFLSWFLFSRTGYLKVIVWYYIRMDCRDQVKPLKDFQELKNVDIVKDLPRASIRNPAARGCKFSIVRDGSELKLEKVPKSQYEIC